MTAHYIFKTHWAQSFSQPTKAGPQMRYQIQSSQKLIESENQPKTQKTLFASQFLLLKRYK